MHDNAKPILVIGGGISGITAAVEAAEVGYQVVLVEKEAFLGGRVMRTHRYFPKMCPPTCGFEINTRRIRNNPRITVYTLATVEKLSGTVGNFTARVRLRPRYVTGKAPIDHKLLEKLTSERPDDFNLGMGHTKAVYLPHDMAYPHLMVVDKEALTDADVAVLQPACSSGAIDLEMPEEQIEIEVGAVIVATGWRPYDATRLEKLGFGRYQNVVTNVMMERLASPGGPTGGKIVRPSDGKEATNVAFVQCAGSRDENHLPYCSAVCCMGSLKQVRYLSQQSEASKATVFYIDIRTIGRLEKFYCDVRQNQNVAFIKGKVAEIHEDPQSHNLTLDVEDTVVRQKLHQDFDLVVLACGIVPNAAGAGIDLNYDEYGFLDGKTNVEGVFAAGCAQRPGDVARATKESTAAALKAIQCLAGAK
ncbi:MAG: FAD-dependent oxidoreductase [bacterium]